MTTTKKPTTTHAERVDELVAEGMTKNDAYAKVAEERSLAVSSIRGAYHRANKQSTNGAAAEPPADPIEAARALLLAAQDQIREEVAAAQAVIDTASERLDRIEDGLRGLATPEEIEAEPSA